MRGGHKGLQEHEQAANKSYERNVSGQWMYSGTMVENRKKTDKIAIQSFSVPRRGSERSERASERMSAAKRASEASNAEQLNE